MKRTLPWILFGTAGLTIIFCASFVYFYQSYQKEQQEKISAPKGINSPLPEAELVDIDGVRINDDSIRKGRVILVFVSPDCLACKREAKFLETAIQSNSDVKFYGVISYADQESSLKAGAKIFPFKVLYDSGNKLAIRLGIVKVPIKILLEDGIIRKAWGGATVDEEKKAEFLGFLKSSR